MHEQRLAGLEAAAVEDIGPDGEEGFGDRGRLDHREAGGNRQRVAVVRHAILRIAAAGHESEDRVANREARRIRAERDDLARDFEPENVGRALRRRISALPLQNIGTIDAGRGDRNENLAFPRRRPRYLRDAQHFGAARALGDDGVHLVGQVGHETPRESWLTVAPSSGGAARNSAVSSARALRAAIAP